MIYQLGDDRPIYDDSNFIAPSADLIGRVRLEKNANVWFNTVLRGDNEWITIGENSNVQDGSIFHTDMGYPLTLGKNVTVGHNVVLHGCQISDQVLVGMGSTILNGTTVGSNTIIGANSFIAENKEIPEGVLMLGSPARVVRDLTENELQLLQLSASHYVENGHRYLKELTAL